MSKDMKCPERGVSCIKCGEPNLKISTHKVDRQSGKKQGLLKLIGGILLLLYGLPILVTALVGLVALLVFPSESEGMWVVWLSLAVGLLCVVPGGLLVSGYVRADRVKETRYSCGSCQHHWAERDPDTLGDTTCPECGKNLVHRNREFVNSKGERQGGYLMLYLTVLFHAGLTLGGAFLVIAGVIARMGTQSWIGIGSGVLLLSVGLPGLLNIFGWGRTRAMYYDCVGCGHTWVEGRVTPRLQTDS